MKDRFQKIIVVGSGKFAFLCAKFAKSIISKVCVYEYKISPISVLQNLCLKNGIEYKSLGKSQMNRELLDNMKNEILIISAFNTYLFPKEIVGGNKITIINYHNAYLPNHPGRNAEAWCIYEQDKTTGVTWHYVNENVDAGDIIIQKEIELVDNITSIKLLGEQINTGYNLFTEFFQDLIRDKFEGKKQIQYDKSKVHYSKDIPNNGILNLEWNINKMYAFLRAMDYGSLNLLGASKVRIKDKLFNIKNYDLEIGSIKKVIDIFDGDLIIQEDHKKLIVKLDNRS